MYMLIFGSHIKGEFADDFDYLGYIETVYND